MKIFILVILAFLVAESKSRLVLMDVPMVDGDFARIQKRENGYFGRIQKRENEELQFFLASQDDQSLEMLRQMLQRELEQRQNVAKRFNTKDEKERYVRLM